MITVEFKDGSGTITYTYGDKPNEQESLFVDDTIGDYIECHYYHGVIKLGRFLFYKDNMDTIICMPGEDYEDAMRLFALYLIKKEER